MQDIQECGWYSARGEVVRVAGYKRDKGLGRTSLIAGFRTVDKSVGADDDLVLEGRLAWGAPLYVVKPHTRLGIRLWQMVRTTSTGSICSVLDDRMKQKVTLRA